MKIIFLDVDGVLNWSGTEDRVGPFIGLCSERIERFNRIIDAHPDAKVVISSTWRQGMVSVYEGMHKDPKALPELLAKRGLKGEVISFTPWRFSHVGRGEEIRMWIEGWETESGEPLKTFVVLDDSTEGMSGYAYAPYGEPMQEVRDLRPNHVVTHWSGDPNCDGEEGGLLDRHIEQAIRVLNGELVRP